MMIIDWIFTGIAFLAVVLAMGKYAHTSKQISKASNTEPMHSCLCTRCAHFKPIRKES